MINNNFCNIGFNLKDGGCDFSFNVIFDFDEIVINVNGVFGIVFGVDVVL